MSWQASGWAKKVKLSISGEKITKAEKHLLLTMADDYVEHLGYAEVSVRELADNSESSERQARYCLRRLEQKRFIETYLGGPGRLSRYMFLGYCDGAKAAPEGKKEHGAKIAPPMGQRLPGANSSMGQLTVVDGATDRPSPPQTPPYPKSKKKEGEEKTPAPARDFFKEGGWEEVDRWLFDFLSCQGHLPEAREQLLTNALWWIALGSRCHWGEKIKVEIIKFLDDEFANLGAAIAGGEVNKPEGRRQWLKRLRKWLIDATDFKEAKDARAEKRRAAAS